MVKRSEHKDWEALKERVIGLGERSFRKSYYPQLRENTDRLERFRALLDHATDFVVLVSLPEAEVVDANAAFGWLLGERVEKLIGRPFTSLGFRKAEEILDKLLGSMPAGERGIGIFSHEVTATFSRNEDNVWLEMTCRSASLDGHLYGVVVGRDITERKRMEGALHKSRDFLDSIINNIPDPVFVKDRLHRWILLNESFCKFVGYTKSELLGESDFDFFPEHEAHVFWEGDEKVFTSGKEFIDEETVTNAQGEIRYVITRKTPLELRDGEKILVGTISDITERKAAEEMLNMTKFSIENVSLPTFWTNSDGRFCYVNDAACRLYGYPREDLEKLSIPDVDKNVSGEFWSKHWEELKEKKSFTFETTNITRDKGEIPVEVCVNYVEYGGKEYNCAFVTDITERKKHEAELQQVANHDMLTGLPNRRLLTGLLEQAVAHAQRTGMMLAVCCLDIDDFKPINDKYGHDAGDKLLMVVAEQLKTVLRSDDALVRLGGDEFILLFNGIESAEDAHAILRSAQEIINFQIKTNGIAFRLSASIGVALYPDDNVDADALLRHADQAMYIAKRAGKNQCHFFDPSYDRKVQERFDKIQRLRQALERNEFIFHYQPKVDLLSGSVVGAEALIRWQHPKRGLLSPAEFLRYMEGSDLEIDVGEYVIDSALKQVELWKAMGLRLRVSANISAEHLLSTNFTGYLQTALQKHPGVSPACFELEIIESAALSDMVKAFGTLLKCKDLGVSISLDDFGTGYSSLTYLRQLPVDILKIDQSFVKDMLTDPSDREIVISIVQLAKTFNREVVAEGVETLELGMELLELGCRTMQGYGIACPMPAEQIPDWINQWHSAAIWQNIKA